ncbi:hypothetical protein I4U23_021806 [Adineta vaga]|nr:hypothetical protein I4U23_021806 [Adineta vaga]
MTYSYGLSFLFFLLIIDFGASLICYQCDKMVVTPSNITAPSNCMKTNVDQMFCTIEIDFHNGELGYLTIKSETAHQAFGYKEDFALLGLYIKNDGSYVYGITYHCLTDGCNEPKLSKLLFESTTIDHNATAIVPLLYTSQPPVPVACEKYTNFTNPDTCYSKEPVGDLCLRCLASIDGITNSMCAYCLKNVEIVTNLLDDERAYFVKTRKTSNHELIIRCNIPDCNRMNNIQQIQKLYRYNFDYDKFNSRSTSALLVNSVVALYQQFGGFDGLDWNTFEADQDLDTDEMIYINFLITVPPAPWNLRDMAFCQAMVQANATDHVAPRYYDCPDLAV